MTNSLRLAAIGLVLALAGTSLVAQTTFEGTLVDSKCYLEMNETDNDHGNMQACGTMCLRQGAPAAVVTRDGQFHPIITFSAALAEYVGEQIRVAGSLRNGAILPTSVQVNRNGRWEEVKLGGMM